MAEDIPQQSNRITLEKDSVAWSPCMLGDNFNHGRNCSIGSLAHIGRNVTMGNNCRIQGSVYIADGCILGDDVFVGPNATLLNDKYPPSGDSKYWEPVIVESCLPITIGIQALRQPPKTFSVSFNKCINKGTTETLKQFDIGHLFNAVSAAPAGGNCNNCISCILLIVSFKLELFETMKLI